MLQLFSPLTTFFLPLDPMVRFSNLHFFFDYAS